MSQTFFGESEQMIAAYEKAAIIFLPVPFDATSSWGKGADKGPDAIFEASSQLEYYDIPTNSEVFLRGMHTLPPVVEQEVEAMTQLVCEKIARVLADKKFPVLIGGNHSVSIGAIRAACTYMPEELTILQLDAHADLRIAYEGSALNHACVMARALDHTKDIVQVGIRSMCKEESKLVQPGRIFYAHQMFDNEDWIEEVLGLLSKNVYISLDLDVFDAALMPATGTPEPGGMQYRQVMNLLTAVAGHARIIGLDVVELAPMPGMHAPDYLAAKLVYQILSLVFEKKK